MRPLTLIFALSLAAPVPAISQSLDGSLNGTLFGSLNGGLQSGFQTGLQGSLGPAGRAQVNQFRQDQAFDEDGTRDLIERQDLARRGIDLQTCALTQIDYNRSGCRPIRELSTLTPTTYDLSISAMAPLTGLTLEGQTLSLGAGPASSLD